MKLMITRKDNTTYLVLIKDDSVINMMFTDENKVIKRVGNSSSEVEEVGIINVNSTKISKLAKLKDLIQSEESRVGFHTSRTRLAFIKLRQVFIEALILHYYNLESYI